MALTKAQAAQAAKAKAAAELAKKAADLKAKAKVEAKPPAAKPTPAVTKATPPAQPSSGPKVDSRLQEQFDAYERTGSPLTETNKKALARQMGIDYGGSTYYGTASDSSSSSDAFGYSKNSGIGSKQPTSKGWVN